MKKLSLFLKIIAKLLKGYYVKTVKTSDYRQRGYLFHSSGEFVIVYGNDPDPVGKVDPSEVPKLVWDNNVNTITTTVSNLVHPVSEAPTLEHEA